MITVVVSASSVVDLNRLYDEARRAGVTCELATMTSDGPSQAIYAGDQVVILKSHRFMDIGLAFSMAGVRARE